MSAFDESKAYHQKEEVFFDDGREVEILHFVYGKPNIEEIRGSPERVLAAIDEFARTKKYLMNVGEDKGKIVTDLIAEVKPQTMASLYVEVHPDIPTNKVNRSNWAAMWATLAFYSRMLFAKPAESGISVSKETRCSARSSHL